MRRVTPLSLARLKFHAALRSSSRFPSLFFFFFFLSFHFFSYTRPRLGNWPPPRLRAPFVRSFVRFEFALPSSRLTALPHFSRRAHTRLLILFPRFPSRAPLRTSVRFTLPFHFHFGVPASRFSGRGVIVLANPLFPLDFEDATLRILRAREILDPHGKLRKRERSCSSITQKSHLAGLTTLVSL